jgi:ABC-type uncharacterized transport system substrate-binding protein
MAARCLYISSYHKGYAWSDGVETSLRQVIGNKCELKQFDMDTKRNKDVAAIEAAALQAKQLIDSWKPDVVITSDDNAVRYLLEPYFRDHSIPFVFCGINWSVEEYGLPYRNTTGIIEIAPIEPLFERIRQIQGTIANAFYIGAKTNTEAKNLARFEKQAERKNIVLNHGLATTTDEWIDFYQQAQQHDVIIVGSNAGINDWNPEKVSAAVNQYTRVLSVTNHDWMMPYTILGLTKIPEEQGEWAAQAALYILEGNSATDIPIVANHKWDIWLNPGILQATRLKIPKTILMKAKKVQ